MLSFDKAITVGARSSPLSQAQVEEVLRELQVIHPSVRLSPFWVKTWGDKNLTTSLRVLEKSDFFTREIDQMQLQGKCRISIHSAKDLPDPLPKGLNVAALTKGVDPSDSLVLREGDTVESLAPFAEIGTSSWRREQAVIALRPDLRCVDIRGTIGDRLALLDQKKVDGLIVAEAALIRLKLTFRNRIRLDCDTAPLQGKLAILIREGDEEMRELFACIDTR